MAAPFENSIECSRAACIHINDILKNCVESDIQPTQETVNGMTVALDALRNSEGKLLDRLNKDSVRDAKAIYS